MSWDTRARRGSRELPTGLIRRGEKIGFLSGGIGVTMVFLSAMEEPMSRTVFGLAGLAVALFAAPAVAHHAFAMFDSSKLLYMTGAVKQFDFVNPHTWLHVTIVNDKGEVSTWAFEGGSPSQLVSLGWSKDHPRVGETIEVGFRPLKDGSRGGQLMSVKFSNGQRVCSNRGCGDGTGNIVPGEYRPQQ
jgi:uncharacterized protein DUF6152